MANANKWRIEKVLLAEVTPFDQNPRAISEKALKGLRASLMEFGYVEPIVFNRTTGHIVGGHQRYALLFEAGVKEAKMVVVELSKEDELAANLTLNNPAIEGEFDEPVMALLEQLEEVDSGLFAALNMDSLREAVEQAPPSQPPSEDDDDDEDEEVDTKCPCCTYEWKIQAGDVSIEDNEDDDDDEDIDDPDLPPDEEDEEDE